jgi:shikimate dehydrogenase
LYSEIDSETLKKNKLIINCTPLGKFPEVNLFPPLPYEFLDSENFLFDLNYNPSETKFLQLGKMQGCTLQNGLEMLHLQAEASWNIWNQT